MQRLIMAFALTAACAAGAAAPSAPPAPARWAATWAAAPDSAGPSFRQQTIRQQLKASVGGPRLRVALSNAYGNAPVTIGPVVLERGAARHALRFDGRATVSIAAGAQAWSDPLGVPVAALETLTFGIYLDGPTGPSTIHSDAREQAQISGAGPATSYASRYFLYEVQVEAAAQAGTLVVLGDSISDGDGSGIGRNARWPDALAERLQGEPALAAIGVVNAGISGNRLLAEGPVGPSMLARLERDALGREGVRWIVLEAGLNDIGLDGALPGAPVAAADVIAGLRQVAERAHARGIEVWAATLTPYGGALQPLRHSYAAEAKRQVVNAWIRGAGQFDRVLDFDAALRDPQQPSRILPALDSGDHVHPNDAGYRALAAAVPLQFFGLLR